MAAAAAEQELETQLAVQLKIEASRVETAAAVEARAAEAVEAEIKAAAEAAEAEREAAREAAEVREVLAKADDERERRARPCGRSQGAPL